MLDQVRQVGVEDDVHAAGDVHLALGRQAEVLGDRLRPPSAPITYFARIA